MATSTTAPSPETTTDALLDDVSSVREPSVHRNQRPAQTVAVRERISMGKKVTMSEGLNLVTVTVIGLFHVGAIAAFYFFSWQRLAVMAILYVLAINVGIGMCYHRLLTHRGYQVPKWIEYIMAMCATTALEGGPIFWVSTHRAHHQLSDREGDPHTPREGKWWAHTGWIFWGDSMHSQTDVHARYSPDLMRDRFHVWMSKYHWLPITVTGILLLSLGWAFGGWKSGVGMVLWGVALRVTLGLHATWLVNSATHLWGSRRFETRDDSRNSWWVALLTGGEGWHNNHHAHPVSARHGLAWYEVDIHYWGIWLLARLGLAKKIQVAKFDPEDPKPAGM